MQRHGNLACTMTRDFLPTSYANLLLWLQNLTTQLGTYGVSSLSMTAAEVSAAQTLIGTLAYKIQAVLAAQTALDAAIGGYIGLSESPTAGIPAIRRVIAKAKETTGYTQAIGEAMQAIGSEVVVDPGTYKPDMTAEAMPGHVRIRGRKKGVQAMNIYRRLKGQPAWQLAAGNRTKFPFDDDAPLAVPNVPETREYSVIGMIANEEVGQRSDIVEVVFGG